MTPLQNPEKSTENPSLAYEEMLDLRDKVPDLIAYLAPDEKVIEVVEYPNINEPAQRDFPSSLSQLLRLAGIDGNQPDHTRTFQIESPLVASKAQETEDRQEFKAFEVLFGRDSLIAAAFLKDYYPGILRGTLLKLASLQGLEFNELSEEERGKIVHEARDPNDPIAKEITARQGWQWPYYGSVDATPLYVMELTGWAKDNLDFLGKRYIDKSGQERTMMYSLEMALGFIEKGINKSDLGLLEYKRLNPNGLQNQWWPDSWDSMSHSDGSVANYDRPIAAIGVQAFAYDALIGASELYRSYGGVGEITSEYFALAEKYEKMAAHIKEQVLEKFWKNDEGGGYFVAGLDRDNEGNIRQIDTKTCHMGFVTSSRILDDGSLESAKLVDQTIKVLSSDEMQNVSGIRTLSKKEKLYKPGGYHTGSVWLWINNWMANGFDKHAKIYNRPDYADKARELREKTWRVVQKFRKFPELVNGGEVPEPVLNWRQVTTIRPEPGPNQWSPGRNKIEQPAQDYQAWTIAAYIDALRKNNPLK